MIPNIKQLVDSEKEDDENDKGAMDVEESQSMRLSYVRKYGDKMEVDKEDSDRNLSEKNIAVELPHPELKEELE